MGKVRIALTMLVAAAIAAVAAAPMVTAASRSPQQRESFDGQNVFRTYCVTCHGRSAKGDGPLAASLKKPPPDLTLFSKNNNGTFPREMVMRIVDGRQPVRGHGGGDMPVWGDAFSHTAENSDPESVKMKIEAVVDYLASVQAK